MKYSRTWSNRDTTTSKTRCFEKSPLLLGIDRKLSDVDILSSGIGELRNENTQRILSLHVVLWPVMTISCHCIFANGSPLPQEDWSPGYLDCSCNI